MIYIDSNSCAIHLVVPERAAFWHADRHGLIRSSFDGRQTLAAAAASNNNKTHEPFDIQRYILQLFVVDVVFSPLFNRVERDALAKLHRARPR
jgi:hypothetical protein